MKELKRVVFLLVLVVAGIAVFASGLYEMLASPVQLILLKTALVSTGLVVAHIARKALFADVDWKNDDNWQHFLAVLAFYIVIPYCFAMGG